MRVLVTGGAGFIGSAVCRHLVLQNRAAVINVDKLTYAANRASLACIEELSSYAFERRDICDLAGMDRVFLEYNPDSVIHLAAESHVDRSITGSAAFINTNVIGTYTMLEAARKYHDRLPAPRRKRFRFIHVSTDEVYGSATTHRFDEETPYRPSSPYSASKAASDHLASAWFRTYGLPVIVSNCSNNYGPFQFPEKLIPLTILNAIERKPLRVYGDGSNIRDWLHVEDHAAGLVGLLSEGRPGEKYNFGGDSERSNLDVVTRICDLVDGLCPGSTTRRSLITFVPDRPGHDARYAVDASKANRELGWRPRRTFEQGLAETVGWYLKSRAWWDGARTRIYDGSRLGLLATQR